MVAAVLLRHDEFAVEFMSIKFKRCFDSARAKLRPVFAEFCGPPQDVNVGLAARGRCLRLSAYASKGLQTGLGRLNSPQTLESIRSLCSASGGAACPVLTPAPECAETHGREQTSESKSANSCIQGRPKARFAPQNAIFSKKLPSQRIGQSFIRVYFVCHSALTHRMDTALRLRDFPSVIPSLVLREVSA